MISKNIASRTFGLVIAMLVIATSLSFAEQVTITVWDAIPASGRGTFLDIVDEFRAANPDINVEVENVAGGYAAIRERTTLALLGNVAPNIAHFSHYGTYNWRYQGGIFMPLNDYIAEDPNFDLDDWYPPFLENVSMDGEIYGIPYNVSTPLTYYSPHLLEESGLPAQAPTTWDEMVEFGKRVTRDYSGDGTPSIWAMDTVNSPGWVMEAFIGQAGGAIVDADRTEFILNSPEGVRSWQFQQDLIHTHRISRYPGAPGADLNSGKVGWWFRSTASLRTNLETAATVGIPISAAALPCDVQCYAPIGGGAFYAMNTGTQAERDATYKLLSFLAESENLARYAGGSGYMAARRSAVTSSYLQEVFAEHPEFLVTYEQLVYAQPETSAPEFDKVHAMWSARATFLDPIYKDNMPVKPVLDDLVRRGNALLREFYEKYERD